MRRVRVRRASSRVDWFSRSLALAGLVVLFGCERAAEPDTPNAGGVADAQGGAPNTGGAAAGAMATAGHATGGAGGSAASSGGTPTASGGSAGSVAATGGSVAAGAAGATTGGSNAGGAAEGGRAGEAGVDPSAELYDPERVPHFDIELSEAAFAALEADGDTYVEGELRYGSETISRIGVRLKGEGSLRTLEEKAAFKLKFDEFVPDQTFRGLRRLTLNNMVEDPSYLAERLAYHVFRAAGLPAPRCNSAVVSVNGDTFGIYANVEAEDKTFLRRWFTSDEGNLYEEGQVDFVPGAEAMFNLETNETANDRSDLANLIAVIEAAEAGTFLEDLDAALDTSHFLRFTAAEAAVNQWDMYSYTMFYPNNFRIYSDPERQQFVFLPWGMDMSMKPFRDSSSRHLPIFGLARRGDRANQPISAGVIFQRCMQSETCKARYAEVVAEIADVYEAADLETLAERYREQIAPHVEADPRTEYTSSDFERGYESLLSTIRERPAAMRADLE